MATYEQLMDAARKADAKGDKTAAKRFLEMATSQGDEATQFGPPEAPQVPDGMVYNPNTDQYTNREMLANNFNPTRTDAVAAGGTQGMTFGFGDELAGVAAGVVGGPDARTFATEEARAFQEASREAHPKTYIGSEIGGAMLTPGGKAKTLPGIIAAGAMAGGAYAAGTSEGDAADRAPDAIKGAIWGGIAAGGTKVALNFGSKAFNKLFTKSTERPTVPMLKATKTQAYKDVDAAGEVFGADEIKGLLDRVKGALDDVDYVEGVDTQTDAALKLLERHSTRDMTIGRLDKLRQNLWKRFGKADNEVGLLDAIEAIDDLIASRADTSDLMKAARLANSRYKKSQMLEDAFDKAMRQTEAAGSGGNVFNKYKQAINAIIDNPRKAKWFNAEELAQFENFVHGDLGQTVMRRIGKLSPNGNGLMQALNYAAIAVDPINIMGTAAATAAKSSADNSVRKGAEGLLDTAATGVINAPKPVPSVLLPAATLGVAPNALLQN